MKWISKSTFYYHDYVIQIYLVHPVILFVVPHASVQSIRGQDQDKVLGQLHTTEEILIKLSGLQLLDVQKDREPS